MRQTRERTECRRPIVPDVLDRRVSGRADASGAATLSCRLLRPSIAHAAHPGRASRTTPGVRRFGTPGWLVLQCLAGVAAVPHSGSYAAPPAAPASSSRAAVPDRSTLAGERGCLSCHGLVRAQVGPGFAQIAARYRDDTDAALRLPDHIRAGSVGRWGRLLMPRQPDVSPADARELAAWILAAPSP